MSVAVAVMMIVGVPFHFTSTEIAAESTIVTAVTSIIATCLIRPVNLGVINTALSTGLVAAAAFGLRLPPPLIATFASTVVVVLGYLLREKVSPVVGER